MPKSSAINVMMTSGHMPLATAVDATKRPHSQTTMIRPARLIKCRPGISIGLPLIRAESLPKAITEPENVTAPISTPT